MRRSSEIVGLSCGCESDVTHVLWLDRCAAHNAGEINVFRAVRYRTGNVTFEKIRWDQVGPLDDLVDALARAGAQIIHDFETLAQEAVEADYIL